MATPDTMTVRSDLQRFQVWAEACGVSLPELANILRTGANLQVLPQDLPIFAALSGPQPRKSDENQKDVVAQGSATPEDSKVEVAPTKTTTKKSKKNNRFDPERRTIDDRLIAGAAPNGRVHHYLPEALLSSEDFRDLVLDLWDTKGFYAEDVTFTDHRTGPKGLEAGGQHYAPGVLRLTNQAPGFNEVRTRSGSPAWVANAFFNDKGEVVIKIGHEYSRFWDKNEI